jgi:plasmid stability protein
MKPFRLPQAATMPVTLSIKNAPDDVVARLKLRAERNHRSLQGELLAIITAAASEPEPLKLDALEVLARVRAKLRPSPNEAAAIVRQMRDERANRRR